MSPESWGTFWARQPRGLALSPRTRCRNRSGQHRVVREVEDSVLRVLVVRATATAPSPTATATVSDCVAREPINRLRDAGRVPAHYGSMRGAFGKMDRYQVLLPVPRGPKRKKVLPNLEVRTGGAEYGRPEIQGMLECG